MNSTPPNFAQWTVEQCKEKNGFLLCVVCPDLESFKSITDYLSRSRVRGTTELCVWLIWLHSVSKPRLHTGNQRWWNPQNWSSGILKKSKNRKSSIVVYDLILNILLSKPFQCSNLDSRRLLKDGIHLSSYISYLYIISKDRRKKNTHIPFSSKTVNKSV